MNLNFNFGFLQTFVWKFLSTLLDDISANLDPNSMIFDSVEFVFESSL